MGVPFGNLLILVIGGKLGQSFGWESIFYFSTAANIIWIILWLLMVRDMPENHPFILDKEKQHIIKNRTKAQKKAKFSAPFKAILLSVPFWAIIMAHWTQLWGFYTIASLLPKYLHDVQGYNSKNSGNLAAISMVSYKYVLGLISKINIYNISWHKPLLH